MEGLIDWMLTSGRQRGGPQGSSLGIRSVRLTLGRFRAALNLAERRQWIARNVAEHLTISREAKRTAEAKRAANTPWNEAEVRTFLTAIRHDRLYAAMMLALIANRPAEVCGTRRQDIDLDDTGTIAIGNTRTIVYDRNREPGQRNKVVEKGTKTESGKRTLPLPEIVRGYGPALPADFLWLMETYGPGVISDYLGILPPVGASEVGKIPGVSPVAAEKREGLEGMEPEYLAPVGLLVWGCTPDGDDVFWRHHR